MMSIAITELPFLSLNLNIIAITMMHLLHYSAFIVYFLHHPQHCISHHRNLWNLKEKCCGWIQCEQNPNIFIDINDVKSVYLVTISKWTFYLILVLAISITAPNIVKHLKVKSNSMFNEFSFSSIYTMCPQYWFRLHTIDIFFSISTSLTAEHRCC